MLSAANSNSNSKSCFRSTGPQLECIDSVGVGPLGGNAHIVLRIERGRSLRLVLIILIEVEQLEPVAHVGTAPLRGHGLLGSLERSRLINGLGTLVGIPVDLLVLVLPMRVISFLSDPAEAGHPQPAHHA